MRGMKESLQKIINDKKVSFVSAGRIGSLENYRSDYDGHRGGYLNYDSANYGSKEQQQRRHQIETLNGAFQTLAARADILIKVKERLRKLFKRDIEIRWDAGEIKVFFSHGNSLAYSSGREASGLLHLVGLLAMIYDDEIGALLLDEPEVSLHPQLQAFLLQEILHVSGWPVPEENKKIIVLCTHSTEFIGLSKPSDLLNLVFCADLSQNPIQIPKDSGELKNRKVGALISRMGQEHKLALFASTPLLVEGPSDVIICASIARKLDLHLEAGGSQILPVIGKGQFPVVSKLFKLMGKNPVILADADAFTDSSELAHFVLNSQRANAAAAKLGAASANSLASQVYNDFCAIVDSNWGTIEVEAIKHPYWTQRDIQSDEDLKKVKRRAAFATLFKNSDADIEVLEEGKSWLLIKERISTLLGLLEAEGCFVLRKGAIESYFSFDEESLGSSKPEAAANEAAEIINENCSNVEKFYGDIIRCLKFASAAEKISEAESLQEVLLAICAPALAKIRLGQSAANLNAIAASITPDLANIFDLKSVNGNMEVSLLSKVLDVEGFPITISPNDDLLTVVATALKLK